MNKQDYIEKLKDPRWQKKRLEILQRDNFTCRVCNNSKNELHVHHLYYSDNYKNPWDYPDRLLITLCLDCHKQEHELHKYIDDIAFTVLHGFLGLKNITLIEINKKINELLENEKKLDGENTITAISSVFKQLFNI